MGHQLLRFRLKMWRRFLRRVKNFGNAVFVKSVTQKKEECLGIKENIIRINRMPSPNHKCHWKKLFPIQMQKNKIPLKVRWLKKILSLLNIYENGTEVINTDFRYTDSLIE